MIPDSKSRPADPYAENVIVSLRAELLAIVEKQLTPLSKRFGYADEPLEQKIRWQPCVLLIGNYSSGKSTFINEILGQQVQTTGQAPTDDSFTIITHDSATEGIEVRDGKTILSSDTYPFAGLRKFGSRLASHVKLKKINNQAVAGLALIDTPGMLDSVSENDRGYDYQQVLAEFAELSDLIIVMFDPHKAGTIRETYESLRKTLPRATYEDRVLFVLNRIDECQNLTDLLRVYGTLCWNLSQMTGRKDIPLIRLTWSTTSPHLPGFLDLIENHRLELGRQIRQAPKYRLDHMVTFIDEHSHRLSCLVEALECFRQHKLRILTNSIVVVAVIFAGLGVGAWFGSPLVIPDLDPLNSKSLATSLIVLIGIGFAKLVSRWTSKWFDRRTLQNCDILYHPKTERDRDSWSKVRDIVVGVVKSPSRGPLSGLKRELKSLRHLQTKLIPEYRRTLEDSP